MPHELPASALYDSPAMGRLWKNVHRSCSPFLQRPSIRRLYQRPGPLLRKILKSPFTCIALGCADGAKESLLFKKMPPPACLWTADINLPLARRAASRLPAQKRSACRLDLTTRLPSRITHLPGPRLITLFGVIPNLDPLPLLRRISRIMRPDDYLLFSANLAPGRSGFAGARKILPQYDNRPTRVWLEAAVRRCRPRLPAGRLVFGVFPDPRQKSLARVEARWLAQNRNWVVFASRRPTLFQVESWIRLAHLEKVARFLDLRGEEGLWLVEAGKF